jgi:acetyltransferase
LIDLDNARPTALSTPGPIAADWSADLVAHSGYAFHVRPAGPEDEAALGEFFTHVDKEDLRFRFLSAVHKVSHDQLVRLVSVDHQQTENFLAIEPDTGRIIATAMIAADDTMTKAEVAIAIRADFKRGGISWTLLDHIAAFAQSKGISTLESVESRDNHEAIRIEHEMGWTASSAPGDAGQIVLRKTLGAPVG